MTNWDYFEDIPEYHPIADANNLYDAFQKSRKGSHWKYSVQKFRWDEMSNIRKLQIELDKLYKGEEGGYSLEPYSKFLVNERGKVRAITALSIRDRVVKHSLNDNYLLPHMKPYLIYDNGASLKGKGVSFSRGRLVSHLEQFYKETGSNDGYILIMDFSGYYDNIDHQKAIDMIKQYEPDEFARKLTWQAYDSYKIDVSYMSDEEYAEALNSKFNMVDYRAEHHTSEELTEEKYLHKSLSVGDQTSQITAILFPTPIDNLIKIVNGIHYYGRYMDDLYVIVKTIEEAKDIQRQIEEKAKELSIIINPKKTKIQKISKTFTFMQFKYYVNENGHVVIRINPKTVKRMRKKLKALAGLLKENKIPMIKISSMFQSWIANYKNICLISSGIIWLSYTKIYSATIQTNGWRKKELLKQRRRKNYDYCKN